MSHQDRMSEIIVNHRAIGQVLNWLLPAGPFVGLKTRAGARWKPRMLAAAALIWAISDRETLQERFEHAAGVVEKVFRWRPAPGKSCQGFMKMLRKWHEPLLAILVPRLRSKMREELPGQWETEGFAVFAVDGSRVELPRAESLEAAFAPKKKAKAKKRTTAKTKTKAKQSSDAKKAGSPQIWLTLLWHVASGLPWSWRSGPSDSSEREHFRQMLTELPENALITADAGFVGYEFWSEVLNAGLDFVIRVGGNVKLLKKLGYARSRDHTVYLWPDRAARRGRPPLTLRLIELHDGKEPVFLVTNLPKSRLSDRRAGRIYAARWGVELFFRAFKQTFGRRKLRSRAAANAPLELDWSLLGLWCVCLLGRRALAESGQRAAELSPALAIRAARTTLRDYRVRPASSAESLGALLRAARRDAYERSASKTSRDYPRKKRGKRTTAPEIVLATPKQIAAAKQLKQQQRDFRLAA